METKANYGLIGLFTLLVIAIAVFMIYWVGRLDQAGEAKSVQISFPGPVSGLVPGSPVNFNGIRVGTVRKLELDPDNPEAVLVDADISEKTPLKSDTRITLGTTGLTGASYVDLRAGSKDQPNVLTQENIPRLQADGSSMDDLLQSARDTMTRVDQMVRRVDEVVKSGSGDIERTLQNAATFSDALADNAPGIDRFLAATSDAAEKIGSLATRLDSLTVKAESLVDAIDPQQISRSVANIESFTANLDNTAGTLEELVAEAKRTMVSFNTFGSSLNTTLLQIDNIVSAIPPEDLTGIFGSVRTFVDSLAAKSGEIAGIIENAEQGSESFRNLATRLEGEGDRISQITTNAASLTETLRSAAGRIEGLFDGLDGVLSSEGSASLMAEAQKTLLSFRSAAAVFELRIGEISNGVSRFSGAGLRNLDGLIADGRRAVNRLDRVLQQLENNPRQFISGSGGVPEYNGRPRR
uniref:MlaD family protein n=1 Tax=Pararhizobium sp. IMCC3301 TaxID=3067904 RepID=UPI002740DD76|nr:MlaD family protein [Pararhizobium sp. IMCC3301]